MKNVASSVLLIALAFGAAGEGSWINTLCKIAWFGLILHLVVWIIVTQHKAEQDGVVVYWWYGRMRIDWAATKRLYPRRPPGMKEAVWREQIMNGALARQAQRKGVR